MCPSAAQSFLPLGDQCLKDDVEIKDTMFGVVYLICKI